MRRNAQVLLLLLSGAAVLHISLLSDVYLRYVKEGLRPALVVSGAVLILLGLIGAARDGFPFTKEPEEDAPAGDDGSPGTGAGPGGGHGHGGGPRIAWLLFFPALTLLFFTPPALGSYTASRESGGGPAEERTAFAPLAAEDPVPLSLTEFALRAGQDERRSLEGRTVRLTGFVTPGEDGRWYLSRLIVNCCAADSRAVKIGMHGASAPPADRWVTVTGSWRPGGGTSSGAALDVDSVRRAPRPANPYQDSAPPAG